MAKLGTIAHPKWEANVQGHTAVANPPNVKEKAHKFVEKEGEQKRKADDSGITKCKLKLAKAYETRIE
jgi:hypothetical protein